MEKHTPRRDESKGGAPGWTPAPARPASDYFLPPPDGSGCGYRRRCVPFQRAPVGGCEQRHHLTGRTAVADLSGSADEEFFADGMTDVLITELAQIHPLRVISRTSSMQYKAAKGPLPETGRALNVDAIVQGQ